MSLKWSHPANLPVAADWLDLFPMGAAKPYRLDFFDDELDEIRVFDPDNQRSVEKVDEIRLLPAHEFPMGREARSAFWFSLARNV